MMLLALLLPVVPVNQPVAADDPFVSRKPRAVRAIIPERTVVPRYGRFELVLGIDATFDNPFDPDDVSVRLEAVRPDGQPLQVDAFYYQPFRRSLEGGSERLEPAGPPDWRVRFAPEQLGEWSYRIVLKDRTGTSRSPEGRFQVVPSESPGFVRRSAKSPRLFAFDSGAPYIAVGLNICWGGARGSFDYDDWLRELASNGGNWMRVWMSSWNCALEWTREAKGDWRSGTYHNVGKYSLENAWKLDTILDTAEKHGIFTMLCFGTYGEFTTGGFFNEGQWKANPYNIENGGPCEKPEDFWTNAQAKALYKRRLRYLVARYGWRTGIHSWEFWNEALAPAPWVAEMARYLRGIDPNRHLITTTYGNPEVWRIPEIDFSQTHHYGTGNIPDSGPVIHADLKAHEQFGKPHLMGEFGIDYRKPDAPYDPENKGVNLHNGLWSSLASGGAGTGMIWWWDNYVHPGKLWPRFKPVAEFVRQVQWNAGEWKPLEIDPPEVRSGPETFADLVVPASQGWGRSPVDEFVIKPTGPAGNVGLPSFLYAPAKPNERIVPKFKVSYAQPGAFIARLVSVSETAHLQILVDGVVAKEVRLSARPPADPNEKPQYLRTEQNKQYGNYVAEFDLKVEVPIPAGDHVISLDLVEGDWVSFDSFTFGGYRSSRMPQMNNYGMVAARHAFAWFQNAHHNWKNVLEKNPIPVISGAVATLRGLPAGAYRLRWWDTWKGGIIKEETVITSDEVLQVNLPALSTDVALLVDPMPTQGERP